MTQGGQPPTARVSAARQASAGTRDVHRFQLPYRVFCDEPPAPEPLASLRKSQSQVHHSPELVSLAAESLNEWRTIENATGSLLQATGESAPPPHRACAAAGTRYGLTRPNSVPAAFCTHSHRLPGFLLGGAHGGARARGGRHARSRRGGAFRLPHHRCRVGSPAAHLQQRPTARFSPQASRPASCRQPTSRTVTACSAIFRAGRPRSLPRAAPSTPRQ